ncbi:hypothetical protein BZA05DRAFT_387475 [Tricharina praecox]|uniref:uncharacterized protein n=1 Tax=Tricharina praecox TaxID=43433 RepID=UPI00221EEF95|nr:uncharacterized protein BZA05DRAFT_387475 [Tricharina praecox]KAI5857176.1 hypothetical protein BZA05DRAFT_387475 [Tricharina praecox]
MSTSTCIICYDPLHTPAVIYPCTHSVFHYSCILSWLSAPSAPSASTLPHHIPIDKTCPLCRCVPLLVLGGGRRFVVPSGTSYVELLGEAREQLLRRGKRLWNGENVAATAWILVQLSALQERHRVLEEEIASEGKLCVSARLVEAQDGMLTAVAGLHARICDGRMREVLKAVRRARCRTGVLQHVWEDVRWDDDCQQPVGWRLDVMKKLVPRAW